MAGSLLQPSFTGGELSPALYARTDLARYANSLKLCRNFIVRSTGGIENRMGLQYLGTAKGKCRLIPFEFNTSQAYVLEVGNQYLRIYRDDYRLGTVELVTPWADTELDEITYTQSADVMTLAHPNHPPQELKRHSETDWTLSAFEFKNGPFRVLNTDTGLTIYASDVIGDITLTASKSVFLAGHVGSLFRMDEENLGEIKPWQADKKLVDKGQSTYGVLRRNDGKVYKCVTAVVGGGPDVSGPNNNEVRTGTIPPTHDKGIEADGDGDAVTSGSTTLASRAGVEWQYLHSQYGIVKITAVNSDTSAQATVISRLPQSCVGGDQIALGPLNFTANGSYSRYFLAGASPTALSHVVTVDNTGVDSNGYSVSPVYKGYDVTVDLSATTSNIITVTAGGVTQFKGPVSGTSFSFTGGNSGTASDYTVTGDSAVTASVTIGSGTNGRALTLVQTPAAGANVTITEYEQSHVTSVWAFGSWNDEFGWPSIVTYYSDRLTFSKTKAQPQTTWMSVTSDYGNFGVHSPVEDDDEVDFTINARQINDIRDLVPLADLILLTSGGEWRMTTSQGIVAPGKVALKPQSSRGCQALRAEIIGNSALFVQAQGTAIRDLRYSFSVDSYQGQDLSILAEHLFYGYQITMIAFQQEPYNLLWCVRSDGALLSMTYLPDQQVYGWAQHHTDGAVESIAVIPGTYEDELYAVVNRTINGASVRYIERLHTRRMTDISEAFFVDAGLTFDGRSQAGTLTVAAPNGQTVNDVVNLTLSGASITFDAGAVGDQVSIDGINIRILEVQSATAATGVPLKDLPASVIGSNTVWSILRNTIAGLDHLEAKMVSVLADGNVQAQKTVTGGQITLDYPAALVHVGLPYTSDMQTLEVNVANAETIRDKPKLIPRVGLIVRDTRSILAGPGPDRDLYEYKQRDAEDYGDPTSPLTGLALIDIECGWSRQGQVFVQQVDPLPMTVLGIIPEVDVAR